MTNCEASVAPGRLCSYKHTFFKNNFYAYYYKGLAHLFLSPTEGVRPYCLAEEICVMAILLLAENVTYFELDVVA
ncbi:MAG TPA: hypothetical protein VIM07_02875 [Chitinophagaceae bacterium]